MNYYLKPPLQLKNYWVCIQHLFQEFIGWCQILGRGSGWSISRWGKSTLWLPHQKKKKNIQFKGLNLVMYMTSQYHRFGKFSCYETSVSMTHFHVQPDHSLLQHWMYCMCAGAGAGVQEHMHEPPKVAHVLLW